ncbi:Dynein heavy chain 5, axonemal [Echinococcus granulosus]|uniref:Dynein heavy chain 5, axonemal n=1 Tax=Echinococcus granulosus TaxID=6210 RepID=W6UMB8_ECHGR|nr:Dynein heavy chain 5, axonemal [Echinococcus granulosus]EUB62286.1 Dynein heavy chain 5, axonemal [Echinococcus granulosus]
MPGGFPSQRGERIRGARENRRALIDDRHLNILMRLERAFGVETQTASEWLLDFGQLEALNIFFEANGAKVLMVTYADQNFNVHSTAKEAFKIQKKNLRGTKRYFFHNGQLPLKTETYETFTCKLDPAAGFVIPMFDYLRNFILPGVQVQAANMHQLTPRQHDDYCDYLANYINSLETVIACSQEHVILPPYMLHEQVHFNDMEGLIALSKTPEGLSLLEENASAWMKKIYEEAKAVELIHVEINQTGPDGEFRFWKCQMTRMNSLVQELSRPDIKNVISVLEQAKSTIIPTWVQLDKKVKYANAEAAGNVKYLSAVEKLCAPLVVTDIKTIISWMPNLMKSLKLLFQCSPFYNTYSHMTVLLVKITNQIIYICKRYLTYNGTKSIWEQDNDEMVARMTDCIEVNLAYQTAYRVTRQGMIDAKEKRIFNFSEVQIFGNMNLFTQRLDYLTRVLKTLKQYSVLHEFVLEGKEPMIAKFDRLKSMIASRPYDYLDHRNSMFEADYDEFKERISEIHDMLLSTISANFTKPSSLMNAVRLQERLETINIPGLEHGTRYRQLCDRLMQEINNIMDQFQTNFASPPLGRNMPPFGGRIAWARNFYRRLEEPMNAICTKAPKALISPDGQDLVSAYNEVTGKIVGYEIAVYQTWTKLILKKLNGLSASLIVYSHQPAPFGRPFVNLDPDIIGLLREIFVMDKLQCPIPSFAKETLLKAKYIKYHYEQLKYMCGRYVQITSSVPEKYHVLVIPSMMRVNRALEPGMHLHNWNSITTMNYVNNVLSTLTEFERLLKQIDDISVNRIDFVLSELSQTTILSLPGPDDPALEIFDLVRLAKGQILAAADTMNALTITVLKATVEMLNILLEDYDKFVDENNLEKIIADEVQIRYAHMENQEPNGGGPNRTKAANSEAATSGKAAVVTKGNNGGVESQTATQTKEDLKLPPEVHASLKTAVQVALAADDMMMNLGTRATEAVCQSVRTALDSIWSRLAVKEAAGILKDIPAGMKVKAESTRPQPLVRCYARLVGTQVDIWPRPAEIQAALRSIVGGIEGSCKGVLAWGMDGRKREINEKVLTAGPFDNELAHDGTSVTAGSNSQTSADEKHVSMFVPSSNSSTHTEAGETENSLSPPGPPGPSASTWGAEVEGGSNADTQGLPGSGGGTNSDSNSRKMRGSRNTLFAKQITGMLETDITLRFNTYKEVHGDREIYRLRNFISSGLQQMKKIVFQNDGFIYETESLTSYLEQFSHIYKCDVDAELEAFLGAEPCMHEFQMKFSYLQSFEEQIEREPDHYVVGALYVGLDDFKRKIRITLNALKKASCTSPLKSHSNFLRDIIGLSFLRLLKNYVQAFISEFISPLDEIQNQIEEWDRNLAKKITNLDDIAFVMDTLADIREKDIKQDMTLLRCEDATNLISKYNMPFPKELSDRVESCRYAYFRIKEKALQKLDHLLSIQAGYRDGLLESIKALKELVEEFETDYDEKGPMVPGLPPQIALDRQIQFKNRHDNLTRKMLTARKGEELFGLPITDYSRLGGIGKELDLLQRLYGLYNEVSKTVSGYYDIVWRDVNMEKIAADLEEFQRKCKRLPKALKSWPAYTDLEKTINDFNEKVPLLEMMTNKAMKPRHWQRLAALTNYNFDVESESFMLKTMLDAPLLESKDDVEDICISAVREKDIEAKLSGVIVDWTHQELKLASFKARGELLLKGDRVSEIVPMLEDSLMILGSLMSNRYNVPFRKPIQEWVQKLSVTSEVLENWMRVQNLWVYLEAVFVGGDIAKQLPQEAKRFQTVDKAWVKVMDRARDNPNVVACCAGDGSLTEILPRLLNQLEVCQKSLSGYLEKKRLKFPRFFFVSDPVLLEILGQASDPTAIQPHLLAIFDNTKSVLFSEKAPDILAAFSSEGERLDMFAPVKCEGQVESWLNTLLITSRLSLHLSIQKASFLIMDPSCELIEFFTAQLAQIGIIGLQIIWTMDATEALKEAKVEPKAMTKTNKHFLDVLNLLINETTKDLNSLQRTKFETLITIMVHQRDIFDDLASGQIHIIFTYSYVLPNYLQQFYEYLVKQGIKSPDDFEWTKQTRTYFNEEVDACVVSITDVDFAYQNEFLGCTERLVITPLTDRCYITLSQALSMHLGGAPAGPAGTGKTETTKDMGRCLGKYVVVFNCSDQMDFRGLGRIYKGLAQSGSWGCFDEFNRIELPVLSVAAQQIAIVLSAKRDGMSSFIFTDGDEVSLDPEFGIFLTMNPGYAGRQELPENLKINFRSVAMMVPDRQIIIRVKLAACGFVDNIILARKFFVLYKLCEEQLTKQVHYDFGLRNILSVLRTLGSARRKNPKDSEDRTVMRGLRDMNLSKLVDQDEPLFNSLIDDLFPGTILEKATYPELQRAIENATSQFNLINHPAWNLKVVQLYETQNVRHGMMALGPSGAGKTACIRTLMAAMTEFWEPHREMRMNPKAITAPEMFGRLDVSTNDWTDGIFSTLWRRTLKKKPNEHIWLILDGPVDAIWIENLNSVLDDNKTLTLANGDRIPMAPNTKILFEVHNIDNASPATVSRNGMVFMSSSVLEWDPISKARLNYRPDNERRKFHELFQNSFPQSYRFVSQTLAIKMPYLEAFFVHQLCTLLDGLLVLENQQGNTDKYLERIYIFALMWSIGALIELDDRARLEKFWRTELSVKLDLPSVDDSKSETIFEYFVGPNGEWVHWSSRIDEYIYPTDKDPEFSSILVPNVDNIRTDYLIRLVGKQEKAVLLTGEQGTAKTVMLSKYMASFPIDAYTFKSLNFSSATTPGLFQRTMESFVEKRVGTTFGPPAGKKMILFVDDISMPMINDWGDQVANEIVRQTMEMRGFYSLDKPGEFTNIVDVQFLAAMIHPGGGRNDIPERLKRQFACFNCTLPSNNSIDKIFSTIGLGHYCQARGFTEEVINMVRDLVPFVRRVWQQTKTKMLPTPAKFHYIFNLRDLSRIWQGIIYGTSEVFTTPDLLIKLCKHEMTRVIADRFIDPADLIWFDRNFNRTLEDMMGEEVASSAQDEVFFVDFMRDPPEATGEEGEDFDFSAPKVYEPIFELGVLVDRLNNFLRERNESVRGAPLDIVFFRDAVIHLVKVSRVIRTPRGNCLLVGVGGSGKRSVTRLATYIADYADFSIVLTRSYNVNDFLDDLRTLYRKAGQEGKGATFVFTDSDVKEEAFLEYMNNMLTSGMVSGLFSRDDIDDILNALIPVMKREFPRRPPDIETLNEYFLQRIRKNLHICLCFSPIGKRFRTWALYFPGLISGCTIDWLHKWPKDALLAVAKQYMGNFNIESSASVKERVIDLVATVHDGVAIKCEQYFERYRRTAHVTPKSYISFLSGYSKVYGQQLANIQSLINRLSSGLQKLDEAQESIAKLSVELVEKKKELQIANAEAEVVLSDVMQQTQAAEQVKNKVLVVKNKCETIVSSIAAEKLVAEGKLEAAKPALEEAEAALNTIKPGDIATVRKLAKPPHLIMRIMDCVLLLFQRPLLPFQEDPDRRGCMKPSWNDSLKLMANTNFLQNLLNFPRDYITEETVDLMEPYFMAEDYNLETAKKVCGNVAGLCAWTTAMEKFYWINKEVIPLKDNLAKQEIKLNAAKIDLAKAEAVLEEKERQLSIVRALFEKAMLRKKELAEDAEACQKRIATATTLIDGLSGEKVRWTEETRTLGDQVIRLVGDVLMATAFLSYCGCFNQDFRNRIINSWVKSLMKMKIPHTHNLDLINMLTEGPTIAEWNLEGLPSDDLSVQNAIIVTQASRYPLLIDPQSQGKNWIIKHEAAHNMLVTTLEHRYFRTHLEDSLSQGRPLLIENIGVDLDPVLDNIFDKNFLKSGTGLKVKVGDKEVEISPGFTLYITTKLPNPAYSPEIFARTSLIDFTVTSKGLEDQLLARVIQTEKEELEQMRINLIAQMTANKRRILDLEDNLLMRLASTEGSLVDDQGLVDVLQTTKSTSIEVAEQIALAQETETEITAAREEYRPVAARGSLLYFLLSEVSAVNPMYQTGLGRFLKLFDESMELSEKCVVTARRIINIIEYMTYSVWSFAVRGMFKLDKTMATLMLALRIDLQRKAVRHEEFMVFIQGGSALDLKTCPAKPGKWISDLTWLNLVALSKLTEFSSIVQQVTSTEKQWRLWFDKEAPEEETIPCGYEHTLDVFRRLLLIRSWCPDRALQQAKKYIVHSLGQAYIEDVPVNIIDLSNEADARTPLCGLLSMGADPTPFIEHAARKVRINLGVVSMGQGQEIYARRLLKTAIVEGNWVLLQNCHLCIEYVQELFEMLTTFVHDQFRLWITTEEHKMFPINLLQIAIKFTNEPPEGIKANLTRTYLGITQDFLEICVTNHWRIILYSLAYLHCTVQERRKYGPLGWCIPYEFNQSDFNASVQFLQNHLDSLQFKKGQRISGIDWKCTCYMISEIQYGGRVTDDFDLRLLKCLTRNSFQEAMFSPEYTMVEHYPIPLFGTVAEYLNYIKNDLPPRDSPEAFGLHTNADINYSTQTTRRILATIVSIQPKDDSGDLGDGKDEDDSDTGGTHKPAVETREMIVHRICTELLKKLPPPYIPFQVAEQLKALGALKPLNIFLRQEVQRMNKVIKLVLATLTDLRLAIDGTVVMNEDLRDALDCIYDARVPAFWIKSSWDSSTLGFWFSELLERNTQFSTWLEKGRPLYFWMTGFFNPQGFLTAMRQEISRSHEGWSLDSAVLSSHVTKLNVDEVREPPPEGVFVYGLFIEGAAWERRSGRLIEARPKILYEPMPVIHLFAVQEGKKTVVGRLPYTCPIYRKPKRTDLMYVTSLDLACSKNPDHWIKRSVALLCDIK